MKYVVFDTSSKEKLEEVSRHFKKFGVRVSTPVEYFSDKLPRGEPDDIYLKDGVEEQFNVIYFSLWDAKRMFPDVSLGRVIEIVEKAKDDWIKEWFDKQDEEVKRVIYICLNISYISGNGSDFIEYLLSLFCDQKFKDMVAYIKEHSMLQDEGRRRRRFVSELMVWNTMNGGSPDRIYDHSVMGSILDKDVVEGAWGWDGKFIPDGLSLTYAELRKMGLKISPRDVVIGKFIKDYLWYDKVIEWKFSDAMSSAVRPIDLDIDYGDVENRFFGWTGKENHLTPFRNLCSWAVSRGLFLRCSSNRKMGVYWWPTGNAGIPITPKPTDHMHERTFHMHDLTHFVVPDLIYPGSKTTPGLSWWYVAYRVLTECVTLVVGDMMYVHHARLDGVDYKTSDKRKIYPIFHEIFGDRVDIEVLPELISASIDFGMRGSFNGFMEMFQKHNPTGDIERFKELLESFKNKYAAYLVQDLKWTQKNIEEMEQKRNEFNYWWYGMVPHEIAKGLGWE